MLHDKMVGFLGTGSMGEALVKVLLHGKICRAEQIICADISEPTLTALRERYGVKTTTSNLEVVRGADIVLLAVKPQIIREVMGEISEELDKSKLVISIAAGVSLESIEACAGKELKLIRVMPNICATVGEGMSAIAAGRHATEEDRLLAKCIFDAAGKSLFIGENLLDAVTGLSGSGPAYVFLIIDSLADAGVKVGLTRKDALLLTSQTILGAARMLMETGEHPGALKDMVTSPGGTTIAGLHALEKGGLRNTLMNAVEASTNRAKALGEITKNSLAGI